MTGSLHGHKSGANANGGHGPLTFIESDGSLEMASEYCWTATSRIRWYSDALRSRGRGFRAFSDDQFSDGCRYDGRRRAASSSERLRFASRYAVPLPVELRDRLRTTVERAFWKSATVICTRPLNEGQGFLDDRRAVPPGCRATRSRRSTRRIAPGRHGVETIGKKFARDVTPCVRREDLNDTSNRSARRFNGRVEAA